ncbi:hypothetical protein KAR91_83100, partial [Candidatus Pacearchaeota archaeon]|nr:hypothetical protein [Candidatus Pacearchaeota archaeon]
LDECGTWFNSRQWGDKSRQAMIDWLLHSRKQGWDVIFIVQNVTLIDKQARLALGEHVVYCRRTDRLNIPVVGSLFKLLWGGKLPLPRVHLGVVKYGLLPTSLSVDTWVLTGNRLFQAYDTKQSFSADYPHGPHTMLPPYYTHCRAQFKRTLGNYMRLTKIYLKRFSRLGSFASGGIVMFILFIFFTDKDIPSTATAHTDLIQQTVSEKVQSIENSVDPDGLVDPVAQGDQLDEPVVFTGPIAFSLDYFIVGNVVTILFDGLRYSLNDFPYPLVAKGEKLLAMLPGDLASYHSDLRLERAASARLRSNDAEAARSDL